MRLYLFFILIFSGFISFGQSTKTLEGFVVDKKTGDPIPYATVYNKALSKGTISNIDGYFRIAYRSPQDSILIRYIGYSPQFIEPGTNIESYTIALEESVQFLSEVTISPDKNNYLYGLISACRKNEPKSNNTLQKAKSYYELKSYRNKKQVELVEGFYNASIRGYDLADLELKAGRLALQPFYDRFFVSTESSRTIAMMRLLKKNIRFPDNPAGLTKAKMKKRYFLYLDKKYQDEKQDSIFVIKFIPRKDKGLFFEGKVWVNKSENHIIKIVQQCPDCKKHPFRPLFPNDSIKNVQLNITRTFTPLGNKVVFNHVDFEYQADYLSRSGEAQEENYTIRTNAILYVYDFNTVFYTPRFTIEYEQFSDYRMINAFPYNHFFWSHNDEFSLNDQKGTNEAYFSNPNSLTNVSIFDSVPTIKSGLLEHPYVQWSEKRVFFREMAADTTQTTDPDEISGADFNLEVKIFVDINRYRDSTDILTATIFDPFKSFYKLPIDDTTHCFINIFFDLCEVERRKLEQQLIENRNNPERIEPLYNEFIKQYQLMQKAYIREVNRGFNKKQLRKWNDVVKNELGIDNMALFRYNEGPGKNN